MSSTITRLNDTADLRTGYLIPVGVGYLPPGDIRIIQMRDISADEPIDVAGLASWDGSHRRGGDIDNHLLWEKDILFISRGRYKRAVVYESSIFSPGDEMPAQCIAGKPLVVIRIPRPHEKVFPEYLAWYINQPYAQEYFTRKSTGVNQEIVTLRVLASLKVALPDLDVQEKIVQADRSISRALRIHQQLALEQNRFFMRYVWNQKNAE
jgi:hypothetical protein